MSIDHNTTKAVSVRAPRAGEIYRIAIGATQTRAYLPGAGLATVSPALNTHFITVRAVGADAQIAFGLPGAAPSLTYDAASTDDAGTPLTLTANTASGATIKDGEERNFRVSGENQFAVVASDDATLELWLSSQPLDAP